MDKPLSIRRQMAMLAGLVGLVILASVLSGYLILTRYYHTAEARFETNARIALNHGVQAVRSTLNFYQGIVDTLAVNPKALELVEFGETGDIVDWTITTANRLPSALGTAFLSADGQLIGEAENQRVGPLCLADLKRYFAGEKISYPAIHREVPTLEHFDLIAPLGVDKQQAPGLIFVSFRLDRLEQLLNDLSAESDQRFYLLSGMDTVASSPRGKQPTELVSFEAPVPDSDWRIRLEMPRQTGVNFTQALALVALVSLLLMALIVVVTLRRLVHATRTDLSNIHQSLQLVVQGQYQHNPGPTLLLETRALVSDIEQCATQLQKRQRQLERDNSSDPLTGLHNRRYFDIMLEHDFMQSERVTGTYLAVIDLNDFKLVNDNYGHITGDEVLKAVSLSLLKGIRSTDLAARIGGDEFALLLRNMDDERLNQWALKFCLHFDDTVAYALRNRGMDHSLSISIGIAPVDRTLYDTRQGLLMAADAAMYQAKENKALGSHFVLAHPAGLVEAD